MKTHHRSVDNRFRVNVGSAYLDLERETICFNENTIKKIMLKHGEDVFLRPIMECKGLSIVDKDTANDFFKALQKIPKSLTRKKLLDFYEKGCWSKYKEGECEIYIGSAVQVFGVKKCDERQENIIELIVGYISNMDDKNYREYYIFNPI